MNKKLCILISILLLFCFVILMWFCNTFTCRMNGISRIHSFNNVRAAQKYIKKISDENYYSISYFDDAVFSWSTEISQYYNMNNFRYYNAFVFWALLKTGYDQKLPQAFYDDIFTADGVVNIERNPDNNSVSGELDTIFVYYPLYDLPSKKKYSIAIEKAYKDLSSQDILKNLAGNYVHKQNNDNWGMYKFCLDGLFMALPFYFKHDGNESDIFSRMNWVSEKMRLENGLYSHGAQSDGTPNKVVWLRGAGWYAMAQIELLSMMKNKTYKNIMQKQLTQFFDGMLKYQDLKTGMWRNIVYPKVNKCNYFESSGTLMMTYSLLSAYDKGYVKDKKYLNAGLRAYNGVMDNNFINRDGGKLTNIYLSSNVKENAQEYCKCDLYVNDEAKGFASLILATDAVNKVLKNK